MTREEALQILDTIPTIGEQVDALELAIEALSAELCEDCISRAEVMKLSQHKPEYGDMIYAFDVSILPSVQPIRPKGEWMRMIADDDDYILPRYRCYKCGFIVAEFDRSNFCPNCGADMRGEE